MRKTALLVTALSLAVGGAVAQPSVTGRAPKPPRPPVSAYPAPMAFPNENKAEVSEIISKGRKIAGKDLFNDFTWRCILSPRYPTRVDGIQYNGTLEPTKIFDQFYSVGQVAVSSFALVTSAGIVLFDTLNNEDEAQNIIVPNLVKMGLDPKDIKYIVITHEHGDHFGGARYLQKTYGAKIIASKVAWDAMDKIGKSVAAAGTGVMPPDRDVEVGNGEAFKVGNTTLHFYLTPGHTPGLVSTIFPVTDNGKPHVVGLYGGTGGGKTPAAAQQEIDSMPIWLAATKKAGVDVLITNHPEHDEGIARDEILHTMKKGDPNPYIIGKSTYQRYMQLMELCSHMVIARGGG